MHIALLNPQGNFDAHDRYWTEHADFGGQLVYVKELARAMGRRGHKVDIVTRLIDDPEWSGFEAPVASYPNSPNVRILRFSMGGRAFLRKEELWPFLGVEWVPNIVAFYESEGSSPQVASAHYGDGGLAAVIWQQRAGPQFTFTAHSLGAQKLERLLERGDTSLQALDQRFLFRRRLTAERIAMNHAARIVTSTVQERAEQYAHPAYRGAVDRGNLRRFAVVPPGVNLKVFDAEIKGTDDARIATHLDQVLERDLDQVRSGLPAILASSRLDRKKNVTGLVKAYADSAELQGKANLLLVLRGMERLEMTDSLEGEQRDVLSEILQLVDRYRLAGKVSGFSLEGQSELAAAYRYLSKRRSVFALTALYEPFGLAPLEAMAAGLPVVVTRNGGPSESLAEGTEEYGVLVDPTDSRDIGHGLLRVLESADEWQRLQRAGRDRVLNRYTWEATADGYLRVFQQIRHEARHEPVLPVSEYFLDPTPQNDPGLNWT